MSISLELDVANVYEMAEALRVFEQAMRDEVQQKLERWTRDVKEEATLIVPVRSGYLRSTIFTRVWAWVLEVGATAHYAQFVEYGTRRMRARSFLRPAIKKNLPNLQHIISMAFEDARRRASL